jgi:hypothetical protein
MKFLTELHVHRVLAQDYLKPSDNKQWFCPDIIDFPRLATFANKDNKLPPNEFISTSVKSLHPESMLVCFLYRLQNPGTRVIHQWANIVAASIELMAENLYRPPPPQTSDDQDLTSWGVSVLQYLEKLKTSSSSYDTKDDSPQVTGTKVV